MPPLGFGAAPAELRNSPELTVAAIPADGIPRGAGGRTVRAVSIGPSPPPRPAPGEGP